MKQVYIKMVIYMSEEFLFEVHFHTAETSPCGQVPAAEGVRLYHEQGYSGIVTTDHLIDLVEGCPGEVSWETAAERFLAGYRAARQAGEALGIAVYLGAEIRFPDDHDNDYLVYGLTEEFLREHEWIYEMDLKAFYSLARENGLAVVQAHPFRSWCRPADPAYLDGAEIYNGNPRHDSNNGKAEAWAEKNGLWPTVGSDFHNLEDLALTAVAFEKMPQSTAEIAAALQAGKCRMIIRS